MKRKQLVLSTVMAGLLIAYGCGDDTVRNVGYRSRESIESQEWSADQRREIIDSISQAYNKETELTNKLISNQLETRDSDINLMNKRYSYSQNITSEGFSKR